MARILIIDDDLMIIRLLTEHLTNEGYEVTSATMAEDGLAMAVKSPPDLFMLDVQLPDATGFQMCGRLRENPVTKTIPIIMMTGSARWPNQQNIGRQMGANEYVLKPFDVIHVGNLVHKLMGSKRPVQKDQPVPPPQEISAPEMDSKAFQEIPEVDAAPLLPAPPPEPELPQERPVVFGVSAVSREPAESASADISHGASDEQRFFDFSVEVLILASRMPRNRGGRHTADQLIKCGTAVGAKIQESLLAESKKEQIRILREALRNLRESGYWLMLIRKSGLFQAPSLDDLEAKCVDLSAVLSQKVVGQDIEGQEFPYKLIDPLRESGPHSS